MPSLLKLIQKHNKAVKVHTKEKLKKARKKARKKLTEARRKAKARINPKTGRRKYRFIVRKKKKYVKKKPRGRKPEKLEPTPETFTTGTRFKWDKLANHGLVSLPHREPNEIRSHEEILKAYDDMAWETMERFLEMNPHEVKFDKFVNHLLRDVTPLDNPIL